MILKTRNNILKRCISALFLTVIGYSSVAQTIEVNYGISYALQPKANTVNLINQSSIYGNSIFGVGYKQRFKGGFNAAIYLNAGLNTQSGIVEVAQQNVNASFTNYSLFIPIQLGYVFARNERYSFEIAANFTPQYKIATEFTFSNLPADYELKGHTIKTNGFVNASLGVVPTVWILNNKLETIGISPSVYVPLVNEKYTLQLTNEAQTTLAQAETTTPFFQLAVYVKLFRYQPKAKE